MEASCIFIYMGPLWRPYCVYMYGCLYGCICIWAHYGDPIVYIWVWFFINKNMIKIEK